MFFSFDAIESLPLFNKLPLNSKEKRILGIVVLLSTSIVIFTVTFFVLYNHFKVNNKIDERIDKIEEAIPQYYFDSLEVEAILNECNNLIKANKLNEAGALLEKLSYIEEPSFKQMVISTKLLIAQGRKEEAQKIAYKLLQEDPYNRNLALLYLSTMNADELLSSDWRKLFKPEIYQHPIIITKVASIVEEKSPNTAIALTREAIKADPLNYRALSLCGKLLSEQKNIALLDEAIRYLNKATKINPTFVNNWVNLGYALQEKCSFKYDDETFVQSEKAYKKALDLEPTSIIAMYNLANLYIDNNVKDVAAESLLRQALAIKEDFWQANFKLGVLLLKHKKLAGAKKALEQANTDNPNNIRIMQQLAVLYEIEKNNNKAKEMYTKILSVDPQNEIALFKTNFYKNN